MNQKKNNRDMYACFACSGGVELYFDVPESYDCQVCKGCKFIWVEPAIDEEDESESVPFIRET